MRTLPISILLLAAAPAAAAPPTGPKPPTPEPAVDLADTEVTEIAFAGGIDGALVERIVVNSDAAAHRCYAAALGKQPNLSGTLSVKLRVALDGSTTNVAATGVPSVAACVVTALKALALPAPHKPLDVTAKIALRVRAGVEGGAFASLTGTGDISSGFDDTNIYGGLSDGSGEATGWGTIGTGRYGTIGPSGTRKVPSVSVGHDTASSDPDKEAVRRFIVKNVAKIQYCYEKQLLADPKLAGKVTVKFHIEPTGKVSAASATGLAKVDTCVADVIAGIEFPKPSIAGGLDVNYPFVFKADDAYVGGSGFGVGGLGNKAGKPAPTVSIGQPNAQGDLDKAIIRRYIKRNIQKIQYCYEKKLLDKPSLAGTVQTQFTIGADGLVTASTGSGLDPDVATCVADVIKGIEFPKPKSGGNVQVNYPFTFRPAT